MKKTAVPQITSLSPKSRRNQQKIPACICFKILFVAVGILACIFTTTFSVYYLTRLSRENSLKSESFSIANHARVYIISHESDFGVFPANLNQFFKENANRFPNNAANRIKYDNKGSSWSLYVIDKSGELIPFDSGIKEEIQTPSRLPSIQ